MIALPRDLAPWGPLLRLFPDELAGELGPIVTRLALAIGPMRTSRPARDGEPDGFAGIARRGSYERLVLTEWLLADEVPEEFARRAAMGEHAFHELARRTPTHAASSVAIFDAGPGQLGAPRLAHLAALVVLAARATAARARFTWGVLGEPSEPMAEEVTEASVLRLLRARTAVPASPRDVAAWAERAAKSGWEDAWIVGESPRAGAWKHAVLEVRDVLEPGRRALAVTARPPSSPPRTVELELPEPRAAVRLLRDPFEVTVPAPRRGPKDVAPASNLVFAVNGTKLLARSKNRGEVLAYPVPNSPRAAVGKPKRYTARASGVVAAAGWIHRGLAMAIVQPDAIVFEHFNPKGPELLRRTVPLPEGVRVAAPQQDDPLSHLAYLEDGVQEAYFVDAEGALVCVERRDADKPLEVYRLATEVAAFAQAPTHLAYAGRGAEGPPYRLLTSRVGVVKLPPGPTPMLGTEWRHVVLRTDGKPGVVEHLSSDARFLDAVIGHDVVAVRLDHDAQWTVLHRGERTVLVPPEGTIVVGVVEELASRGPALVVIESDLRTISFLGRSSARSLPKAPAPIADVATNPWRRQLAYATAAGEIAFHALHDGTLLGRFVPE